MIGLGLGAPIDVADYFFLLVPALGNLLPDYLSYVETRLLLNLISAQQRLLSQIALLIFDVILSLFIFVIFAFVGNLLFYSFAAMTSINGAVGIYDGYKFIFAHIGDLYKMNASYFAYALLSGSAFDFSRIDTTSGIYMIVTDDRCATFSFTSYGWVSPYLYSTFATSSWIWLYMVSLFAIKALLTIDRTKSFVLAHLDIESKPFGSIGLVMPILLFAVSLLGLITFFGSQLSN
jgi:hypothetical protein